MEFISTGRARLVTLTAVIALSGGLVHGQSFNWGNSAGGNWSINGNWTGGTAPSAGGSTTTVLSFGLSPSYTATDNLAGAFNLNMLNFTNAASTTVTLGTTGGTLNFTGTSPSVQAGPGNGTLSMPVTFDNLSVSPGSGSNVSFQSTVNGNSTSSNLIVTGAATGSVSFAGGGTFNQLSIQGGSASATGGTLALTQPNDATNSTSGLQIGSLAGQTGTFSANSGATVNVSENAYIGDVAGSTGTVTVTGSGTTLSLAGGASNRLAVGNFGSGTLNITSGGVVNTVRLFQNRQSGSGTSTILVDGTGSTLHVTTQAVFGSAGVGNATVQNGGTITADSLFTVAINSTGNGTVTITGMGSTATVGLAAEIAPTNGGVGLLTVQNGASFSVTNSSGALLLGSFDTATTGGNGTVTVTGTGSTISVAGVTQVATNAGSTGTLNVLTGGSFNASDVVYVGYNGASGATPAANGTVTVSGANAVLTATAGISVGGDVSTAAGGTGLITVQNGGAVVAGAQTTIGTNPGGVGTLTIQSGGTFTQNATMFVGVFGINGSNPAAMGTVNVTGTGSSLSLPVTGTALIIGGGITPGGTGNLNVTAGGSVAIPDVAFGLNAGSSGTGVVDHATLTASDGILAGINGTGSFTVQNGGTATTPGLVLAATGSGSTGTILVTGAGSTLTATGGAILGGTPTAAGGIATMTVSNQGFVSLPGGLELYTGSSASLAPGGTMTVGGLYDGITGSNAGTVNLAAGTTLVINDDGGSFSGTITGAGSIAKTLTGTQALSGTNTYNGGTTITGGAISVTTDASLGGGPVTIGPAGTLIYTASTTSTGRTFNMSTGGTISVAASQTLTLSGAVIVGGYLDGAGSIATATTGGTTFRGVTTTPSITLTSNSGSDRFVRFNNGGALAVAATVTGVVFNGLTNQGSGSVTLGQDSQVSFANFQSYGTLTLNPGSFNGSTGNVTQITNTGTSPLYFNTGSRTFISTPAQASNGNAGFDLHGNDAIVAGGLFVNNGFVYDSVGAGTHRVVADYGSLVKGAGFYQPLPRTINGGTFIAGNSPGRASTGMIILGGPKDPNQGLSNYTWQINDAGPSNTYPSAPGVSGPTPNAANQVSGWGYLNAVQRAAPPPVTNGNFQWDATSTDQFTMHLTTLLAPNNASGTPTGGGGFEMVGDSTAGLMSDFDPSMPYTWRLFSYQGTYTGPTDTATLDASTNFDLSGFHNPHPGQFDWVLNQSNKELDLVYTPSAVPEPGTLSLVSLAGLAAGWRLRRRFASRS
jgi:T5SS/PEP-CTERM-associated repeat protein